MLHEPVVDLKNCSVYQAEYEVLKEVNLVIDKGEFVYLVGKTGSGKSSFLKTLYGALELKSGEGKVCGEDLKKMNWKNISQLRRKMGIIFQDFNLLNDRTIKENLIFVLKSTGWKKGKEMDKRINDVLASVGLEGKAWKSPHQLSGGEQQRVVIARALLNEPLMVLADEPTGNLDPETADDIVRLIRQVCKERNMAVVFATHNYNILETYPGRVVRCQSGRLLDEKNYLV